MNYWRFIGEWKKLQENREIVQKEENFGII